MVCSTQPRARPRMRDHRRTESEREEGDMYDDHCGWRSTRSSGEERKIVIQSEENRKGEQQQREKDTDSGERRLL